MPEPEHFDVVVVGAGLSGIGAAYHLKTLCADHSFVILEGREDLGGTWDLFRYPGIRSDSDMHTLGFRFKPWTASKSIADGPAILEYLREAVAENSIEDHIRFRHLVQRAEWSSENARWTIESRRDDTDEAVTFTCGFLYMCSGYYSYKGGYTPEFEGRERFQGEIVHPQAWPEDLDYTGKRVVIIGSGATAVTLLPAMTESAAHVTMLQRSPTYMVSAPDHDVIADTLRKVFPDRVAYAITRKKNTALTEFFYNRTRTAPDKVKAFLLKRVRKEMGDDFDIDTHFTPRYNPWDQRICLVPNSDFFAALRSDKADVVTDHIECFTEKGIELVSGTELEADIIITATGLQLVTVGEMDFFVDGEPVDFSRTWTYKGLAYSDVPNMVSCFGYIAASWTLRADLTSEYVCRLLNRMRDTGTVQCTPRLRPEDRDMTPRPWIDDFSSGYMQRMMPMLPKQGDRVPWVNTQSYTKDKLLFRKSPVDDGVMQFTRARSPAPSESLM